MCNCICHVDREVCMLMKGVNEINKSANRTYPRTARILIPRVNGLLKSRASAGGFGLWGLQWAGKLEVDLLPLCCSKLSHHSPSVVMCGHTQERSCIFTCFDWAGNWAHQFDVALLFFFFHLLSEKCYIDYDEDLCLIEYLLFLIESAAYRCRPDWWRGFDLLRLLIPEYRNNWSSGSTTRYFAHTHTSRLMQSHKHCI